MELERDKKTNSLHTGGAPPPPDITPDEEFDKSLEDLPSARPGSPEFLKHMRALEARKKR